MRHPRVEITDLEARFGTRATIDTLEKLKARYPGVRFVWLMGSDNLAGFHRWGRWEEIMAKVPVGVLARPGEQLRAGLSPAACRFARARLPMSEARTLPWRDPRLVPADRADARPLLQRAARHGGLAALKESDCRGRAAAP